MEGNGHSPVADVLEALDAIPRDQLGAAIARLAARAMEPAATRPAVDVKPEPNDELLTPDEVAALLKADRRFVYRNAKALGAVRLSRRKLRFSARRVRRYLDSKR